MSKFISQPWASGVSLFSILNPLRNNKVNANTRIVEFERPESLKDRGGGWGSDKNKTSIEIWDLSGNQK